MMKQKVTPSLFSAVKIMLENGATTEETAKFMKVSSATVKFIRRSETIEEYRNILAAYHSNKKKKAEPKQEEPKQEIVLDKTSSKTMDSKDYYMITKLIKAVEEQNELLKLISAKMVFIVEQLA